MAGCLHLNKIKIIIFKFNKKSSDTRKPYGGVCNKTSDCYYTDLSCIFRPEQQDYACLCPAGNYFSLVTMTCTPYTNIGDLCFDNYECPVNSTCEANICTCAPNLYYNVPTTNECLPLKSYTDYCTANNECNSLLGFTCNTVINQCDCGTDHFFNGTQCNIKLGQDNHLYGQFCQYSYECRSPFTRCFQGMCLV